MKLRLMVLLLLSAAGLSLDARANGEIEFESTQIDPPPFGDPYIVTLAYQYFFEPDQGGADWDVVTSLGTRVAYRVLVSSDFTAQDKSDLSAQFEQEYASDGISANQRVGEPSARHNCFGYALGMQDYWINSLDEFIEDDYILADAINASLASHGFRSDRDWEHASVVVIEYIWGLPFVKCQGKYGHAGIYRTSASTALNVYDLRYTRYWW